jgi:hypothetical protein
MSRGYPAAYRTARGRKPLQFIVLHAPHLDYLILLHLGCEHFTLWIAWSLGDTRTLPRCVFEGWIEAPVA